MSQETLKAIAVTAELLSTELSRHSLKRLDDDLNRYPETVVFAALERCRRELTGRLTLGAIIERISEADGRPEPDEAWSIAIGASDEAQTVIWCLEIRDAYSAASSLMAIGDKIGARMAFREAYARLVRESRERASPASWIASLGWDKELREKALLQAVQLGRMSEGEIAGLLPLARTETQALRLGYKGKPKVTAEQAKANIQKIQSIIGGIYESKEMAKIAKEAEQAEQFERERAEVIAKLRDKQIEGM